MPTAPDPVLRGPWTPRGVALPGEVLWERKTNNTQTKDGRIPASQTGTACATSSARQGPHQGERGPQVTVGDRGRLSLRVDVPNTRTESVSPSMATPGLSVPHMPCKSMTSQGRGVWVFSKFQDPRRGNAGPAGTTGTSTWRPHQGGHKYPPPARQPRQRPKLPTKGGFEADNSLMHQGQPSQASTSSCQQRLVASPPASKYQAVTLGGGNTRTKAGSQG